MKLTGIFGNLRVSDHTRLSLVAVALSLADGTATLTTSLLYPYGYFLPIPGVYTAFLSYVMLPSFSLWTSVSGVIVILATALLYFKMSYAVILGVVITVFSGISIGLGLVAGGSLGAVGGALALASSRGTVKNP